MECGLKRDIRRTELYKRLQCTEVTACTSCVRLGSNQPTAKFMSDAQLAAICLTSARGEIHDPNSSLPSLPTDKSIKHGNGCVSHLPALDSRGGDEGVCGKQNS